MKITVTIKSQYGNERIFPACPCAERFAKIAGTKTFSLENINDIKALGYEVIITTPSL